MHMKHLHVTRKQMYILFVINLCLVKPCDKVYLFILEFIRTYICEPNV